MIQANAVIIATTLNTIRYSMFYLIFCAILKPAAPVLFEQCARHSLDTDDPSDRNCSCARSSGDLVSYPL